MNTHIETSISVEQFCLQRQAQIEIDDDLLALDDILLRGYFFRRELRQGLSVYFGEVTEFAPFAAKSQLQPGLSCVFYLTGHCELIVGNHRFELNCHSPVTGKSTIESVGILHTDTLAFLRRTHQAQNVCYLVVNASMQWLKTSVLSPANDASDYRRHCDNARQWCPSARLQQLIREITQPVDISNELRNLYLECRAVEIILETLGALLHPDSSTVELVKHDQIRLQRAHDMIAANLNQPLSVEAIAQVAGLSTSGLQKLFRRVEGVSVYEYVRRARMTQAFTAIRNRQLSIAEASRLAGYKSPENFSTAFKRMYGITPSAVFAQCEKNPHMYPSE